MENNVIKTKLNFAEMSAEERAELISRVIEKSPLLRRLINKNTKIDNSTLLNKTNSSLLNNVIERNNAIETEQIETEVVESPEGLSEEL